MVTALNITHKQTYLWRQYRTYNMAGHKHALNANEHRRKKWRTMLSLFRIGHVATDGAGAAAAAAQ